MFKLIKIQNSGVNVPEPQKFEKSASLKIKAGDALIFENGIIAMCPATSVPTHIAFSDSKYNEYTVFAYPINSNMLFETTVGADPSSLLLGSKVTVGKDSEGSASRVTATTTSGVATIVDLMNAARVGDKITVKF